MEVGDKYKSKNGLVGEIKNHNGVLMLEVRNNTGKIIQTIVTRKIDLTKFERIEDASRD